MSAFDPAREPYLTRALDGVQLIEASAGTGKTFTISALYLRLVLGHGDAASGFGRELLPPQILVVTFTDAATKELRERIRTRLAEAARFFRGDLLEADSLLQQLRERQDETEEQPQRQLLLDKEQDRQLTRQQQLSDAQQQLDALSQQQQACQDRLAALRQVLHDGGRQVGKQRHRDFALALLAVLPVQADEWLVTEQEARLSRAA